MGLSFAAQAHTPVRWYFNPRAPCGARPAAVRTPAVSGGISIHAPLAGRDEDDMVRYNTIEISIHAPLAGRDDSGSLRTNNGALFQSTRPLRGATARARRPGATAPISIHAPLAGRDLILPKTAACRVISIHAPLAGRDEANAFAMANGLVFQSTHPLRGATRVAWHKCSLQPFQSTHPLRGATANLTNSYPQICTKATKGIC